MTILTAPRSSFLRIFPIIFGVALLPLALSAQLVVRVTAVPVNTPAGAKIHIAGTFNNWDPGSQNHILAPQGSGEYAITLTGVPTGQVKFKFTRGSWATVEGNANGGFQPDHVVQYNGGQQTVSLPILSWEDLGGTGGGGTAAPNVSLLDDDFYIPQLNRTRRIWIYLPPDYQTSTKKYPVLYMQDGQNLFDAAQAAFGEWKVDESLNDLFNQGDYGCIVVGIANGGAYRLDEYSPWVNPQYGGGDGDEYVDFIANTLKPYIDANYRTLPGRWTTGIGGSSMGGLISHYALIERQDVFAKAAVFSPAFWFGGNNSINHVLGTGKQDNIKVYFLAGGNETNDDSVPNDMMDVADAMLDANFSPFEIYFTVPQDGQHSEWFWAREFPDAYVWLFKDAVSSTLPGRRDAAADGIEIFPNPAGDWLRIVMPDLGDRIDYQIVTADGHVLRDGTLRPGEAIRTSDLPEGFYFLKMKIDGRSLTAKRFYISKI